MAMHRLLAVLSVATLSLHGALAQVAPTPSPAPPARDVRFLVLLSPGPNWQHGKPLSQQSHLQEHLEHYRALIAAGKVQFGGPYLRSPGHGMVVPAEGVSEADASEFARNDPAVHNGVLTFVLQPWLVALKK